MIVPNYIPEPMEVPGNVTEEVYAFRVGFIRRVTMRHLVSVIAIAFMSRYAWPSVGLPTIAAVLAAILVALDLWRIVARKADVESTVSGAMLPLIVVASSWLICEATRAGWPVWASLLGIVCAAIYAALCGRDFSFMGSFFLAWIVSSVTIASIAIHQSMPASVAGFGLVMNTITLAYHQYDLASLLSRRRRGEEWAAVVDLYRDIFNVFGYIVRCVRHWRKHRIWEIAR